MSYHCSLRAKPNDKHPYRSRGAMSRWGSLSLGSARGERWYEIGLSYRSHGCHRNILSLASWHIGVKRIRTYKPFTRPSVDPQVNGHMAQLHFFGIRRLNSNSTIISLISKETVLSVCLSGESNSYRKDPRPSVSMKMCVFFVNSLNPRSRESLKWNRRALGGLFYARNGTGCKRLAAQWIIALLHAKKITGSVLLRCGVFAC